MWPRGARFDPRLYQIAVLALLLAYGTLALDFELRRSHAAAILVTALGAQLACSRFVGLPRFDPLSALISALSLCLLLRTNEIPVAAAAAVIAIGSKFAVRVKGKHLFNPTNIALVALLAFTDRAWISPGQWGSAAYFAFLVACVGGLVVTRASRADVTLAFAAAWSALVVLRSVWLGEPMVIPVHRLENGALVIFTFFMISDPRTTPDSRAGRIVFAAVVAFVAYYIQFRLYRTNALLWALASCAPLVPLVDIVLPGRRYAWPSLTAVPAPGGSYEASAGSHFAGRPDLVVR
jgi:Na+-transporting NADH:ubiquinone oxidoreductase subunit NqrB